MFFYDHAMSKDDFMDHHHEEEHESELDMLDGLRAMAMFKKNPGPLESYELNQQIKKTLSCFPEEFRELVIDGFISDSLKREIEQMMDDRPSPMEKHEQVIDTLVVSLSGPDIMYETGNPKKKKKKKKKPIPTNKALYARVKAEAKRKFDVYPSAYANAWLVRTYKKRGGGYRMG